MDDSQNINARNLTVFSNCVDCLNPGSLYKNLFGLTYPGGDNPTTYGINGKGAKASYEYVPNFYSEYPAIGHDRRYDNLKISGTSGLLMNTKATGTDYNFALEELNIVLNLFSGTGGIDRLEAGGLGVGLGLAALPKTLIKFSTTNNFYEFIQNVRSDYRKGSQGVTNTPTGATPKEMIKRWMEGLQ